MGHRVPSHQIWSCFSDNDALPKTIDPGWRAQDRDRFWEEVAAAVAGVADDEAGERAAANEATPNVNPPPPAPEVTPAPTGGLARYGQAIKNSPSLILLFAQPWANLVNAVPATVETSANRIVVVDKITWRFNAGSNSACQGENGQTTLRFTISYDTSNNIQKKVAVDSEECADKPAFDLANKVKAGGMLAFSFVVSTKLKWLGLPIGLADKFVTAEDLLLYLLYYESLSSQSRSGSGPAAATNLPARSMVHAFHVSYGRG